MINYPVACIAAVAFTIAVCVYQMLAFRRLVRYVRAELRFKPNPAYLPKVSLVLPCKGLDPGFKDNVLRLLRQDYRDPSGNPAYEVIFCLADQTDPSYEILHQVVLESKASGTYEGSGVREKSTNTLACAKIVVAGYSRRRAQKVNNQLAALEQIDPGSQVLVFADSDVIARTDFLTKLVAPLEDQAIGATTGYRFYLCRPDNLASVLRSLWNRMSAWEMADPKFAFAWGGAMAIRKELFQQADVSGCWDRSADDDLALTTAVRKAGKKIHFVPQCIVTTESDDGWRTVVEWMNRQLILTKVYFRPLWVKAVLKAGLLAVWLILFIAAAVTCYIHPDQWTICLLVAMSAIIPVELYFLVVGQFLWSEILSTEPDLLSSCLAIPLGHLILPWLTLYSLTTNRISWRGVNYELHAPDNVVILKS